VPPDTDAGNVWEIRDVDDRSRPAYERRLLLRTANVLEEASRHPGAVRGILCVLMLDEQADPSAIFGAAAGANDLYVAFFGSVGECSAAARSALEQLASDQAA
jgi:hypothetical protein